MMNVFEVILKIFLLIVLTFFVEAIFIIFYQLFKCDEITPFGKKIKYFTGFTVIISYLYICGLILGLI
jgi:hypothetical protein